MSELARQQIIITDLTRFNNQDKVCTAGIDVATNLCIRPLPYFALDSIRQIGVLPGTVLESSFSADKTASAPHIEDHSYSGKVTVVRNCSSAEFRNVLRSTLYPSIEEGFQAICTGKCILATVTPPRSLITIQVEPANFNIVPDRFKSAELRATFVDGKGTAHDFLSITDLGFYLNAVRLRQEIAGLSDLNNFLHEQDEVYLRIGLSRRFKSQDNRDGYWIQVNGIYTFPDIDRAIRSYQ
jgi:hypothetical protein